MKPVLVEQDFIDAASTLDCLPAAVKAVCQVEAPRGGFNPDGTPVTLFEGHKFFKYTKGAYAAAAPDLCFRGWTRQHYGKTWQAEQQRLQRAMALDRTAALMSASWGKFQIMGFNHGLAGFETVQGFVNAMYTGERAHLMAFVEFTIATGLTPALRACNWAAFARGYNGASYAENKYDTKLQTAFEQFTKELA
jgi:N-acetylmuramidase